MEGMEERREVSVDEALSLVGSIGPFQLLVTLVLIFMVFPVNFQVFIMYFSTMNPTWKCATNSSTCMFNTTFDSDDIRRCAMARSDWEFTEAKEYSLVTQFDMVCDRQWLKELVSSIFFASWGVGSLFCGWVCDNYGRRIVLIPCYVTVIGVGFISSFLPNIYAMVASRLVIGFAFSGTYPQMFVLLSEVVGRKFRHIVGMSFWLAIPVSYCAGALLAYVADSWKQLSIYSTAPFIFIILFYKFLPESFIWLRMHGRMEQVVENLKTIGKWNKRELPDNVTIRPPESNTKHKSRPVDLFRNRDIAISSAIQFYAWTVVGMVYYGLSLEADNLGGSMYRDFMLLSIVDIPAIIMGTILTERFGRKRGIIIPMLLGSTACLSVAFVPTVGVVKVARVVLGIGGKFLVGLSFYAMYTWSVELYPVHLRSEGIALMQLSSKLGGCSAPWIANSLLYISASAPYLFMGIAGIISALLEIWLPETIANHKNVKTVSFDKDVAIESSSELKEITN